MAEDAALLFANEAFYRAFTDRDLGAMERLWAEDAPVSCLHPGWAPLAGRAAVLKSWSAILGGPNPPSIACRSPQAFVHGDFGLVLCYEQIGDDVLVASNGFVRRGSVWKLVHHQAGPVAPGVLEDLPEDETSARH